MDTNTLMNASIRTRLLHHVSPPFSKDGVMEEQVWSIGTGSCTHKRFEGEKTNPKYLEEHHTYTNCLSKTFNFKGTGAVAKVISAAWLPPGTLRTVLYKSYSYPLSPRSPGSVCWEVQLKLRICLDYTAVSVASNATVTSSVCQPDCLSNCSRLQASLSCPQG